MAQPSPLGAGGPAAHAAALALRARRRSPRAASNAPRALPPPPPVSSRTDRTRIVALLAHSPERQPVEVNLGVTTESNLYVDMDNEVAEGGVFIATYQALPNGTPVALQITLPGALIAHAHGHVTLRRDSLDAFDDPTPGVCVAFDAITPEALALLERFAAKRTPWLIENG